jgi:hypothetical protein
MTKDVIDAIIACTTACTNNANRGHEELIESIAKALRFRLPPEVCRRLSDLLTDREK